MRFFNIDFIARFTLYALARCVLYQLWFVRFVEQLLVSIYVTFGRGSECIVYAYFWISRFSGIFPEGYRQLNHLEMAAALDSLQQGLWYAKFEWLETNQNRPCIVAIGFRGFQDENKDQLHMLIENSHWCLSIKT